MDSMKAFPNVTGSRFGSVALGIDRVDAIRAEHELLCGVASDVCAVDPESLTTAHLDDYRQRLSQRAAVPHQEVMSGTAQAIERLALASAEGASIPDRSVLASDAAIWVLALGRCPV